MTKGELVRFLESYTDDTQIFVITRESIPAKILSVAKAHGYTWPGDRLSHEVWLQLEE